MARKKMSGKGHLSMRFRRSHLPHADDAGAASAGCLRAKQMEAEGTKGLQNWQGEPREVGLCGESRCTAMFQSVDAHITTDQRREFSGR